MDSGEVPIAPLLRLLPGVRRAVPEGTDLRGRLRASGTLRTEGSVHHGHLRVALRGADVRSEALTLVGDADLALDATAHGEALRAELTVDAPGARVLVPERFDKPAGAPLHLHARGEHDGARTTVSAMTLSLPGAHVEGDGSWNHDTHQFTTHLSRCAFELAALLTCLPAEASRVPARLRDATVRFTLQGEGDADVLGRSSVQVTALDLRTSVGNLHGGFDVTGLDTPHQVRADLWGDVIDGEAVAAMVPSTNDRREPTDWLHAPFVEATLRADALRLHALTLSSPRVELTLGGGRVRIRTLRLGVAGGTVQADDSTLSLTGSRRVEAHVRAEHLDLFALSTASGTELSRRPNGSLDVTANVTAEGATPEALRASADGMLHLAGINLVMHRVANPTVSIVLPLLGAREVSGGNRAQRDPAHPLTVRTFDAPLRLEHGAIHTTSPITADTDAGAITLTGTIGADDRLALSGQIRVPPETIAQATGGQRIPGGPVPVSIRVTGTAGAPHVEVDDLGATLRALAGSRLRGILRGIFQ